MSCLWDPHGPGGARALCANVKPATCATRKRKAGLIELGYTWIAIEKLDFVEEGKGQESMNQPRPEKEASSKKTTLQGASSF